MKKINKIICGTGIAILASTNYAIGQNWQLGGNPDGPPNPQGLLTNSNFFGGTGTSSVRLGTGGTSRIFINGTTVPATTGFVGIGTNFISPLNLVDVRNGNINVGQGTIGNIPTSPQAYMIGGNNVLWHNGIPQNIYVGVGAGANTIGPAANENTFVGSRAGFANTIGLRNTFMGANAGESIAAGDFNTFIGTDAGRLLNAGDHNTFVGEQCGDKQITGNYNSYFGAHTGQGPVPSAGSGVGNNNTFLGGLAGSEITNGDGNTFTGFQAGRNCNNGVENTFSGINAGNQCNTGSRNTMSGTTSGLFTTSGNQNVFLGNRSGIFNRTGSNNTYIGNNAGPINNSAFWALNNASAVGNGAAPRANNQMILGNNAVNVGIGLSNDNFQNGPQNRLEIDAGLNGLDIAPSNAAGSSGLRFRDLHSGNTTVPNPGTGVLSVNSFGDVIYVPGGTTGPPGPPGPAGAGALGNICGSTTNPLTNNWEIPMAGFNFMYSGASGNFGIGHATSSCNTVFGRFEVINSTRRAAVVGSTSFANAGGVFGVLGQGSNTGAGNAIGVRGQAGTCADPTGNAIGIRGESEDVTNESNYGGFFVANSALRVNIAVYGNAPAGPLTPTTAVQPPAGGNYAGYFNGNVVRTGSDNFTSDQNLKQNIDTIPNAMGIINQLKPKSFDYKQSSYPSMSLPPGKQYGLIAQDVFTVLPELVNNNIHPAQLDSVGNVVTPSFNYLSLEYQQLIGIMLKGMQEQQAQIKKQDSLITVLSNQINSCCSNTAARKDNSTLNQLDIELSDKDAIVLNQNVPNPFAEQTTITYNVPVSVEKAQLLFFNANGQVIQTVDIKTRGKGKVNVFASDLSSGLYHYTLVADGKVVDSKKMVRE